MRRCAALPGEAISKSPLPRQRHIIIRPATWKSPLPAKAIAFAAAMILFLANAVNAADAPAAKKKPRGPTLANVAYGTHERQVLDFYKAESDKPTPVVFFIHGGGWLNGDKSGFNGTGVYLAEGISVVAINYRLIPQAEADGLQPPVKGPLHDAARALQFVRSKAAEWNIDKQRIGASGSSAGACSSLWLAFHPDLADPQSTDPVARESTRLWCAGVYRAQTSLDPQQMAEWIPNMNYGAHAFGIKGDAAKNLTPFAEFLARRAEILPWITEYSPYGLLRAGAPPIYIYYNTAPAMGQPQESPAHSANFGVKLQEKCRSLGVECELVYPGAPDVKHPEPPQYLIEKLKSP
jgi:acetyl esterase/lipase